MDKWSLEHSDCPGGQAVGILKYKDQIDWGPFVLGDQILGTECDDMWETGLAAIWQHCMAAVDGDQRCIIANTLSHWSPTAVPIKLHFMPRGIQMVQS